MHDEMLERRLRDALRTEGDSLGLTITPAELERRLAARRRAHSTRSFGLLLAAALSVGALGAAAVAGGIFNQHQPSPAPSQLAQVPPSGAPAPSASLAPVESATPVSPAGPAELPSLDSLLANQGRSGLLVAQEHGPGIGQFIDDEVWAVPSFLEFGPFGGVSAVDVTFGCVSRAGTDRGGVVVEPTGSPSQPPDATIPCDGTMSSQTLPAVGDSMVRVAIPRQAGWRLIVRANPSGGGDAPTPPTLETPVADPGQMTIVEATGDHRRPQASSAPNTTKAIGSLSNRPIYHAKASCVGGTSMAWLVGVQDTDRSVAPDTTTILPCDGAVHDANLVLGELGWRDVFVRAGPGTDWHLLVTADPSPIRTAPDVPGWKHFVDGGPMYMFDDIGWTLADNRSDGSSRIRVVISCLGGRSVDVDITPNNTSGDPPIQSYTVSCSASEPVTDARIIQLPQGSYNVDTQAHGRMWYATTVQNEVPASAAP